MFSLHFLFTLLFAIGSEPAAYDVDKDLVLTFEIPFNFLDVDSDKNKW